MLCRDKTIRASLSNMLKSNQELMENAKELVLIMDESRLIRYVANGNNADAVIQVINRAHEGTISDAKGNSLVFKLNDDGDDQSS